MEKALQRLHRQLLADANHGNGTTGALVIVGSASDTNHGSVTSFSGGHTAPIVMVLVKEMQRDPGILASVRMALMVYENNQASNN